MRPAAARRTFSQRSAGDGRGERPEVGDQQVDVGLVVLDRDEPLLDLAPRRQEHAAVVLEEPVRVAVAVIDTEEAAVVADRLGGEHHAALGPDRDHVGLQPGPGDLPLDAADRALPQRVDPLVRLGGGHLGEHGPAGGHRQRVAVEGADHLVAVSATWAMTSSDPPTAAMATPPPMALARQMMSGVTPVSPVAPLGPAVRPVLTSSKVSRAPARMQQVLQPGQETRLRLDDARVHHDRLDDHPGDLAGVLIEQALDAGQVVKGRDQGELHDRLGDARAGRDLGGPVRRADLVRLGGDRHLDRVVVAVVAALHLDDQVPAGDRPHQVHRVHGGLGARVAEPPQRQAEPPGQFLADRQRVLGGLGEVRAQADLAVHRLHDGRVGVARQRCAVTAVQVDVLVAVHVVDLGALAVAEPDRLRHRYLPAGGHASGQAVLRRGGPSGPTRAAARRRSSLAGR